jgi:hypothetical protein
VVLDRFLPWMVARHGFAGETAKVVLARLIHHAEPKVG